MTLAIVKPASSFKTTSRLIAYSADLSEPAGTVAATLIYATREAGGVESVVYKMSWPVADPSFTRLATKEDLAGFFGRKPGTYVLRFLRGATVLAEGTFRLVSHCISKALSIVWGVWRNVQDFRSQLGGQDLTRRYGS
jgi:hypothetical protein